ncbi:MAG: DUF4296 domain-containing protein [Paludibacteraceae bacterium]|nr:DUF4296 domain-containing protein [Paludibacteraceae bacterium]
MKQKQTVLFAGIVVVAVVLDQLLKLYIHSHFMLGESREILPFFQLCYIENDGMAFGIEWFNKIFLTFFRIAAVGLLGWYTHTLITKRETRTSYLAMVALVTAGALGNIIDCVFYGKLFGYAGWFYGRVIDMLYFPLITDSAGECIFFQPVFNLADSCITVAVICILIWFRKDLDESLNKKTENRERLSFMCCLLSVICLLPGCRPRNVLSPQQMEDIFVDLHTADGVLQELGYNYGHDEELRGYYQSVLRQHGTTQAQFDSSLVWYTAHPAIFDKIYPKVLERLQQQVDNYTVEEEK